MTVKQIEVRVAASYFWPGFQVDELNRRFPSLERKYRFVADNDRPDIDLFSVFKDDSASSVPLLPDRGIPRLLLIGENVAPDMTRCEYAISFQRGMDAPRHMRIPNWVHRLTLVGIPPETLLTRNRALGQPGERFCAFIHQNRSTPREDFFRVLSSRKPIDSPGRAMNNMPAIGGTVADKLDFFRRRRFAVAFENASSPGYTTEKIPEARIAGAVPIYWGDPLVGLDFDTEGFLDLSRYGSMEELADAVLALDSDPAAWQRMRERPVYADDRLPDCADQDRIFAFWDDMLSQCLAPKRVASPILATGWKDRVSAEFRAFAADTSNIGFHGDINLVGTIGTALETATAFIETGTNRGVSLAYAASLRPDIPMRGCELHDPFLADARRRCAPHPQVEVLKTPSPTSLLEVIRDLPHAALERPVFWLDAHASGVPLPLGLELILLTRTFPRGHLFIDDFQVPGRPWFGFDSYPDGIIGWDYMVRHIDPTKAYSTLLPAYRNTTSTHHPLRGWCGLSWGQRLEISAENEGLYERGVIAARA